MTTQLNSFDAKQTIVINSKTYSYYDLNIAATKLGFDLAKLPISLKILFENLLRNEDGSSVTKQDIEALAGWLKNRSSQAEIDYRPARVLMQDFTGVPAIVDLAAMRDAMKNLGGNPEQINPQIPVSLVIDHSVIVDSYATANAYQQNVDIEMARNLERYKFLRWGQNAFDNFKVVPPGTGICHQVNLEFIAKVVWQKQNNGETELIPDTLVGTDSHTTMVNGLSVLGWGVGGIEAEAAMLGQPISMLIPEVIGMKFTGKLKPGTTATDLVLTVTEILRRQHVVGKFVEFFGPGLDHLPLADRATISNMAPEYGATCGFFPVDEETLKYLELTNRNAEEIEIVKAYCQQQQLWRNSEVDAEYTKVIELDLGSVEPSIAGPKRPQDRISLSQAQDAFVKAFDEMKPLADDHIDRQASVEGADYNLGHGSIAIAAITSCTNTSNPSVLIGAGLIARKARALGLNVKPWVKTSLAPGSKVVTEYLNKSGLQEDLDALGFNLVGYGCTTCIGNSGPLKPEIESCIEQNELLVSSVLSGNRNFEGRIHPHVKTNYLASPMLVVAYAIAGSMNIDLTKDVLAVTPAGQSIYLKDLWPDAHEIQQFVSENINPQMFAERYSDVFAGTKSWQELPVSNDQIYHWQPSTYIANPPYFEAMKMNVSGIDDIKDARILGLFGDSITTDHISPAGNIAKNSAAATYLMEQGVSPQDFNSYGARRGNHEVMIRGTFANIRIKNEMAPGTEGGFTTHVPTGQVMTIFDAAQSYRDSNTPLIVIAGKEYGTGSSRDWAAKGTKLLGVKAVIAESFERIHRSNLVGMGVLPLEFTDGNNRQSLNLTGKESFDLKLSDHNSITPRMMLDMVITYENGKQVTTQLLCRIDTVNEVEYFKNGGILNYVVRKLAA